MVDMGMAMNDMDMDSAEMGAMGHANEGGMGKSGMQHDGHDMGAMQHGDHAMPDKASQGDHAMMGSAGPIVARHGPDRHGPGNISVAEVQRDRLAERGTGYPTEVSGSANVGTLLAIEPQDYVPNDGTITVG